MSTGAAPAPSAGKSRLQCAWQAPRRGRTPRAGRPHVNFDREANAGWRRTSPRHSRRSARTPLPNLVHVFTFANASLGPDGGNAGACARVATRVGGHARGDVGHDRCTIEDRPHAEVYGEQEAREGQLLIQVGSADRIEVALRFETLSVSPEAPRSPDLRPRWVNSIRKIAAAAGTACTYRSHTVAHQRTEGGRS